MQPCIYTTHVQFTTYIRTYNARMYIYLLYAFESHYITYMHTHEYKLPYDHHHRGTDYHHTVQVALLYVNAQICSSSAMENTSSEVVVATKQLRS